MKHFDEFKKFVKEHKKEIIIGTGVVVVGGLIFVITKKKLKIYAELGDKFSMPCKDLEKPNISVGKIDEFWQDNFGKMAIVNDITVKDIGTLGQNFLQMDGVTNDTKVSMIMGLLDE